MNSSRQIETIAFILCFGFGSRVAAVGVFAVLAFVVFVADGEAREVVRRERYSDLMARDVG